MPGLTSVRGAGVVLGVVLAALASLSGGCDVCGLIEQDIVIAPDDPELGGLLSDCMNGVAPPPSDVSCATPTSATTSSGATLVCSCLPLCERVYAIVNPDPGRPQLEGCRFLGSTPEGVQIKYRSKCQ